MSRRSYRRKGVVISQLWALSRAILRQRWRIKRRFLVVSLLLMSIYAPAFAEANGRIKVDAADRKLTITGWMGEENVFVGNLRLVATGGNVEEFIFLPYDLKQEDGDAVIPRQRVALPGELSLSEGMPKDFQVNVTDVLAPGTYEGEFKLLVPGQDPTEAVTVPLKVVAKARPAVRPLGESEQVQLNLVHCYKGSCWLAERLLSSGSFINKHSLLFENPPSAEDTRALNSRVVLKGQYSGKVMTEDGGGLDLLDQKRFPANDITRVPLVINRDRLSPDHYTGAIHLTMEGGLERLTVPVDLNVRSGPIWVIPALLLGILLGQLVRVVEEKRENETRTLRERIWGEGDGLQRFLKLVLIIGLLAVGVETLYINQGTTFGANPVPDYITLAVWGLSADVASRTLTKLRGG